MAQFNSWKSILDNLQRATSSRHLLFLLSATLVFVGFFVFSTSVHRVLLYMSLIIAISSYQLYSFQVIKAHLTTFFSAQPALLCATLIYLILNSTSILWTQDPSFDAIGNAIKLPIFIGIFVLSIAILFRGEVRSRQGLELFTVFAALIAAFISIYASIQDFSVSDMGASFRLQGTGRAVNSNIFAQMMCFAILITSFSIVRIDRGIVAGSSVAHYSILTFCVAILSAVLLLTGGRGAMLALFFAVIITTFFSRKIFTALVISFLILVGAGIIFHFTDIIDNMSARGDTYRFRIWEEAWGIFLNNPVVGLGASHQFDFVIDKARGLSETSVHNIFLATLATSGALGLMSIILLYGTGLVSSYKVGIDSNDWAPFALLCYGIIVLQFSGHTIFSNLSHDWLFIWLPIAYIFSYSYRQKE